MVFIRVLVPGSWGGWEGRAPGLGRWGVCAGGLSQAAWRRAVRFRMLTDVHALTPVSSCCRGARTHAPACCSVSYLTFGTYTTIIPSTYRANRCDRTNTRYVVCVSKIHLCIDYIEVLTTSMY